VLRIFGTKREEEVVGGWRILYNKELHNLYASQNIIGVIKLNEIGRTCSMHSRDEKCIFWLENLKGCDKSEDLGIDRRIISEWILGKQDRKLWSGCICLRIGTSSVLL